jgi:hypothetical protein
VLVIVDQPASIGALPIAVARCLGIEVAYLPRLAMRRIAAVHPAKARPTPATPTSSPTLPAPCPTPCAGRHDDETLAELFVLDGFDDDLAAQARPTDQPAASRPATCPFRARTPARAPS